MECMKCPFCGKDDIEVGLTVCSGCQAEIRYGSKAQSIRPFLLGAFLIWLGCELGPAIDSFFHLSTSSRVWTFIAGGICIAAGIILFLDKKVHFERRQFR